MQCNLLIILFLLCLSADGQQRAGVEEFFYVQRNAPSTVVPRIYYQTSKGWYGEARYNYEEEKTLSFYVGKTFSKQDGFAFSFTPVAGLLLGKGKGVALGMNTALAYRNLTFSSASQYTFSEGGQKFDFFYSWSELGWQLTNSIYTGIAMQQTRFFGTINNWDPGLQVAFLIQKWTFPFYIFDPTVHQRHFVLGVTREWNRQEHLKLKQ